MVRLRDARWHAAQAAGSDLHDALFAADAAVPAVVAAVEGVVAGLPARRAADFEGAALWAAGARCTEYFSRWIELKETAAAAGKA